MTDYFRRRAILPPTSLPIELTMASIRTPAHVRHPRMAIPRPDSAALWAPNPVCMDVTSADRAVARYVVALADGAAPAPVAAAATAAPPAIDPGDLREPFTFASALGYASIAAPVIGVILMLARMLG